MGVKLAIDSLKITNVKLDMLHLKHVIIIPVYAMANRALQRLLVQLLFDTYPLDYK